MLFDGEYLFLYLRWTITFVRTNSYTSLWTSEKAKQTDSLFIDEAGLPLTRNGFINKLKTILTALGFNEQLYSGHSFRSGAATTASSSGVEDSMIQTLGRWKSGCFRRYVRTSKYDIKKALEKLSRWFVNSWYIVIPPTCVLCKQIVDLVTLLLGFYNRL